MLRKNWLNLHGLCVLLVLGMGSGCSHVARSAADLGFAGAGGIAGYQLSHGKGSGAAVGAATGYLASKVAQSQWDGFASDAEKRGYDRGMNQAVKQQYWLIQNQQRASDEPPPRTVPVQLPAQTINGVIINPRTEYIRVFP